MAEASSQAESGSKRPRTEEKEDAKVGVGIFSVFVRKADFKFNAAHFIAYDNFRERLHGHNYEVGVRLEGSRVGPDGYVVDFGVVKKVVRGLCKEMNEKFILPMRSDVLDIAINDGTVSITCQDGAKFSLPQGDCMELPIVHSSVEEIAALLCGRIIENFTRVKLQERGVRNIEITVSEAPGQEARYTEVSASVVTCPAVNLIWVKDVH